MGDLLDYFIYDRLGRTLKTPNHQNHYGINKKIPSSIIYIVKLHLVLVAQRYCHDAISQNSVM